MAKEIGTTGLTIGGWDKIWNHQK